MTIVVIAGEKFSVLPPTPPQKKKPNQFQFRQSIAQLVPDCSDKNLLGREGGVLASLAGHLYSGAPGCYLKLALLPSAGLQEATLLLHASIFPSVKEASRCLPPRLSTLKIIDVAAQLLDEHLILIFLPSTVCFIQDRLLLAFLTANGAEKPLLWLFPIAVWEVGFDMSAEETFLFVITDGFNHFDC